MKEQIAIQNLLQKKLADAQSINPSYSLRSYALKLGVHVGALSHILNGKRNVSYKLAERITSRLLLDPQERSEVLRLFPVKKEMQKLNSDYYTFEPKYLELNAAQFKVISEWEHLAILSLLNCKDFLSDINYISKRLGITLSKSKQAVDRLVRLELLKVNTDGKLVRSEKPYRTIDDVADISIKKHHNESLDLAKRSLYSDSINDRDFTTITFAIDKRKLSAAKEMIRKFQDDLSELLECGQQTEVYRLSVQLFPLTQIEYGEKNENKNNHH